MSKTIDERVVEMRFDNKQFESNVQTSLSTIEKLKKSLDMDGATKGLESIDSAAKKVDMSGLGSAVETVKTRFSALEVMAVTALANITNSVVNTGKQMLHSLTIEPISQGFEEYELKMGSIQTTMMSTGASLEEVNKYLKVVMVENYNVTAAEKLIPACDISEQISLASKEASGTGNMKFMLNGALTLGTEDGANVEIHELVGDENIFIFGESSETVIEHYKNGDYDPLDFYIKDKNIKEVVDFIVSDEIMNIGCEENLIRLYKEILRKDWFMGLLDFKSYCNKKEEAFKEYENRESWAKKALINISKAGYFSSDRTIEEYNKDIWKLK